MLHSRLSYSGSDPVFDSPALPVAPGGCNNAGRGALARVFANKGQEPCEFRTGGVKVGASAGNASTGGQPSQCFLLASQGDLTLRLSHPRDAG